MRSSSSFISSGTPHSAADQHRRRLRRLPAVAAVIAAATLVSTSVSSAAVAEKPSPADVRIAKAGVLQLSDFPPGFRATPSESDDAAIDSAASSTPSCRAYATLRKEARTMARAESQDFQGDTGTASNLVVIYPTEARAARAFKRYSDPTTAECLRAIYAILIRDNLKKQPEVADQLDTIDVDFGQQSTAPLGDDTGSYSATITVRLKNGLAQRLAVENLVVRNGRAIVQFGFQADGPSFPLADDYEDQIDSSLGRVSAQL